MLRPRSVTSPHLSLFLYLGQSLHRFFPLHYSMASFEEAAKDVDFGPLDFPKNVDVNDDLLSEETLAKIADYSLLDVNGKQVPFRSLYEGTNGEKKNHKVLVVFVRHFYCGVCSKSDPAQPNPRSNRLSRAARNTSSTYAQAFHHLPN